MKKFAVILDRDYQNSPICQIIASADVDEELKTVKFYEPYGAYLSIASATYVIRQLFPLTLFSSQNNEAMPAHICGITELN